MPTRLYNLALDARVARDLDRLGALQPLRLAAVLDAGHERRRRGADEGNVAAGVAVRADQVLHGRRGAECRCAVGAAGQDQDVGCGGRGDCGGVGDDADVPRATFMRRVSFG